MKTLGGAFYFVLLFSALIVSQTVVFDSVPSPFQFYARESNDSAIVPISGHVNGLGYDSIFVEVYREGIKSVRLGSKLTYIGNVASFSFHPAIRSELAFYGCRIYHDTTLIIRRDSLLCGDAYLISGQSNAAAIVQNSNLLTTSPWLYSFGYRDRGGFYPGKGDITFGRALPGDITYSDSARHTIGAWGLEIGLSLVNTYHKPIFILNRAFAGTGIAAHQRKSSNPEDTNTIYGCLLYAAKKSGLRNKFKAMIWHQGESDSPEDRTTALQYKAYFDSLHKSWKTDFPNLSKIYVFQLRPGGCGYALRIVEQQRKFQEYYTDVNTMATNGIGADLGCHYGTSGYKLMGDRLYPLIARDFYGSIDTASILAPNIRQAVFANGDKKAIKVFFDQPVHWTSTSKTNAAFVIDSLTSIDSVTANLQDSSVTVFLPVPTKGTAISYVSQANLYYPGPWLINTRGIGALSFEKLPIGTSSSTQIAHKPEFDSSAMSEKLRVNAEPNPFNPSTRIHIQAGNTRQAVVVKIFTSDGKNVKTLNAKSGTSVLQWNSLGCSCGVYLIRVTADGKIAETRAVLLK